MFGKLIKMVQVVVELDSGIRACVFDEGEETRRRKTRHASRWKWEKEERKRRRRGQPMMQ